MNSSSLRDELKLRGEILQTTVGNSMEPMLHNKASLVRVKSIDRTLKRYELPLYQRPSGQYVMHRILRVKGDNYIICGDNRLNKEVVPKDWVIGVVTEFKNGDKFIPVTDKKYRLYVHLWCDFFYLRCAFLWGKSLLQVAKSKI